MKMKFRYLVNSAMLWTALALGSCADFLDREPYSEPVDESYWNSEDDVEAAVKTGADGVHIGQSDMDGAKARALLGPDKILGISARTVEQAQKAQAD